MNIKLANALFDDGTFSELYKAGFITEKVFEYREIFLWVDAQVHTRKISKTRAAAEAEVKFNKSHMTIWKALRAFSAIKRDIAV